MRYCLLAPFLLLNLCILNISHAQQQFIVGQGELITSNSDPSPININYESLKFQTEYTIADFNNAGFFGGNIARLGFYVVQPPNKTLPNYTLSLGEIISDFPTENITQVYFEENLLVGSDSLIWFEIDGNYFWDGRNNLMVETCFGVVNGYTSTGQVKYDQVTNASHYLRSDGQNICDQPTTSPISIKPQLWLEINTPKSLDIGIQKKIAPEHFCAGDNEIKVLIANYGSETVSSFDVYWKFEGEEEQNLSFSQTILPVGQGDYTDTISLGNKNFEAGTDYHLLVWTKNPNGGTDLDSGNDTLKLNLRAGLNGTYTIGGIQPDFNTLNQAIDELHTSGICGDVKFNLRDGIYNEQIELNKVNGASADATVTFTTENQQASNVLISYAGSFNNNFVVKLNGSQWINFENLSFQSTDQSYNRVFILENRASNISIKSNIITGINDQLIYGAGSYEYDHIEIKNNQFKNGSYGVYLTPYNNPYSTNLLITGNTFSGQLNYGLYVSGYESLIVEKNEFQPSATSYYSGIYVSDCKEKSRIIGNRLMNIQYGAGIFLSSCNATDEDPLIVANNFVHIAGTEESQGIYSYAGSYQMILYNSINILNTHPNSKAFNNYYGTNKTIQNNIFSNKGEGFAIYYSGIGDNSFIDFNDLFSSGQYLGYYVGSEAYDLTEWKSMTMMDSNSISADPLFLSDTSFHTLQIELNGAGKPNFLVTDDLEGDMRDNVHPDIGADEFTPPAVDAGLTKIFPAEFPFEVGEQALEVQLKNFGTDVISSVTIDWTVDGAPQTGVSWTGNLASKEEATVSLGNATFNLGEGRNIRAWVINPNGQGDMTAENDTVQTLELLAGLGGDYTIGGSDADFDNFQNAVHVLNSGGIYADTRFLVRTGSYNEKFIIENFPRSDTLLTTTFSSESENADDVVLFYNSSSYDQNYVIQLAGARDLIFSHMTISSKDNSYHRIFDISDHTYRLRFESLVMESNRNNSDLFYAGSNIISNDLTIKNCTFIGGYYGLNLQGTFSQNIEGLVVENNHFKNQSYRGIYLYYAKSAFINKNIFTSDINYSSYYALYTDNLQEKNQIEANQIYGLNNGNGIHFNSNASSENEASIIANNYIQIGGTSQSYGIYSEYGNYQQYYYNTLNITNTNEETRAFYSYQGTNKKLLNNIISIRGDGYVLYTVGLNPIIMSDHNDLFSRGEKFIYYNGNEIDNLENWQLSTGYGLHSLSEDPLFVQDSSFQTSQIALNGSALPITSITVDIQGDMRDEEHPDIGADEFDPPAIDAGTTFAGPVEFPFIHGTHQIIAILKNFGTDPLFTAEISWMVNNETQTKYEWSGTLLSNDTAHVVLGEIDFSLGVPYNLVAWTQLPNGTVDPVGLNDTIIRNELYAGLSGTYTIGGDNPDFKNINDGVTTLVNGGVVGAVQFKLRDGIYEEQVIISKYPGADSVRQVVFGSESEDTSKVTITFDANYNNNYLIQLNGTSWLKFENLTFEPKNSFYGRIIELTEGTTHITFSQNHFIGIPTTRTWIDQCLIYSTSQKLNEYLTISDNKFTQGSYGLYLDGAYNNNLLSRGLKVIRNNFVGQYYHAINIDQQNKPYIAFNHLVLENGYLYSKGINVSSCYLGGTIAGNTIIVHSGDNGLYMSNCGGDERNTLKVYNNFISVGRDNSGEVTGIYTNGGNHQDIIFNSVLVTNSTPESKAFYNSYGTNRRVLNNIFANSGGGMAAYILSSNVGSAIVKSDHNNFFTTGDKLGYWNEELSDLNEWKAKTSMDSNSISINPTFNSQTDLHTTSVNLDKAGTPIEGVSLDIDGDARDPIRPDIGADEYSTTANDAILFSLDYPVKPFGAMLQPIYVTISNNGQDTLKKVTIDVEINGQQLNPFTYEGVLLSGQTQDSLQVGTFTFELDTSYQIKTWVSNPNGVSDEDKLNDTVTVNGLFAGLGGIYTIGGNQPDFESFSSAILALSRGGIVDNVRFEVRPGTYSEQLVVPAIVGASSEQTITFGSEDKDSTAVIISSIPTTSDNYLLQLNGCSWISFEQLSFMPLEGGQGRIVEMINGAHNNSFRNNYFKGIPTNSNSSNQALVYSGNTLENDNLFENNFLEFGSYAFYLSGQNNSEPENGNQLTGNILKSQHYCPIYAQYQEELLINQNKITEGSNNSSFVGIYLNQCRNQTKITANNLFDLIRGRGLYIINSSAEIGNEILVANNFIQIGDGNQEGYGMDLSNCNNVNVYHNNIHVISNNSNSFAFRSNNSTGSKVLNNIFVTSESGKAYEKNGGAISVSNFNNLFSLGSYLGSWEGMLADDLDEWKMISGLDAGSFNVDPIFLAPNDLHISEVDLNGSAFPIAEIKTDIDGEIRNAENPDIGADEFSPIVANDAGIVGMEQPNKQNPFPEGEQEIRAILKNNGYDTISTVDIYWKINNNPKPTYNWEGNLIPGMKDTIILGTFNFDVGVGHTILAYTKDPDGQPDGDISNDTFFVTELYPGLIGTYTIGGEIPDFNSLGEAAKAINEGGMLGPVQFAIRNGFYTEKVEFKDLKGNSPENTFTVHSASMDAGKVTLSYTGQTADKNYIIRIDETDYVTIQNLSFVTGNTHYATAIELINGANNVSIKQNIFRAETNHSDAIIRSHPTSLDNHLYISENEFKGAGYGMVIQGQGPTLKEEGSQIIGNLFQDQRNAAIYTNYQNGIKILDNEITTTLTNQGYFGIFCSYADGMVEVSGNRIYGGQGHGIWVDRFTGTDEEKGLVANNFIHTGGNGTSYGLQLNSSSKINIYYNSIHQTSSNASSSAFRNYYGRDNNVVNNIFANTGGGYAIVNSYSPGVAISDYNNYYTTGPNLATWNFNILADLESWKSITSKDDHSLSVDPLFTSETDLHCFQPLLDSAGFVIGNVTIDIDGESRDISKPDIGADEFNYILDDVGITAILSPESGCNIESEIVKVRIQNYSGLSLSGFNVAYQIEGNQPVIENIGGLSIAPGDAKEFDFVQTVNLSEKGRFKISAYTLFDGDSNHSNDTAKIELVNVSQPDIVHNMLPADGASGLSNSIAFSWLLDADNITFDLYVWKAEDNRPEIPTASDISALNYLYYNGNPEFGQLYNWQLVAKNEFCSTEGPIQSFRLFDLPDLGITKVEAPISAFSGNSISISWEVKNNGKGNTGMTQWTDAIYFSEDPILDLTLDDYMTGVRNVSALNSGESYMNTATLTLPDGLNGTYYFFVWTDRYNYLQESDNDNNTERSNLSTITLSPPPDLQVTAILTESNVFSGMELPVNWTVSNSGTGGTKSGGWTDRVYLSETPDLDLSAAVLLGQKSYNQILGPDSMYMMQITGNIPQGIFGTYYVIVVTDYFNQEFEFASESNNTKTSEEISITLTPPPNILVENISLPGTAANLTKVIISYSVFNEGEPALGIWYDRIYFSAQASDSLPKDAILLSTITRKAALQNGERYEQDVEITIPDLITGPYFLYVHADFDDRIYEYIYNEDNIKKSPEAINILTPDLSVSDIVTISDAMSGDSIIVNWKLSNIGSGAIDNKPISCAVFISEHDMLDPLDNEFIGSRTDLIYLNSSESTEMDLKVKVPEGISGNYKIFVHADNLEYLYEVNEENNVGISDPLLIQLAPWVDLFPISLEITEQNILAGQLVQSVYKVKNSGTKSTTSESWIDKLYISKDVIFDPNEAQQIRFDEISETVAIDSAYEKMPQISVPIDLLSGNYYFHLVTDADQEIYEHNGESNNLITSSAVLISGYPEIDLKVTEVAFDGSFNSGSPINVTWKVVNTSLNNTISGGWFDAIYLSKDTIWDDEDVMLAEKQYVGELRQNKYYEASLSADLPNGLAGIYHVLVINDYTFINRDFNRGNNTGWRIGEGGLPQSFEVTLTPPPDLIIKNMSSPVSSFAGQPIDVSWTVENVGPGKTNKKQWIDRIFLSEDLNLDQGDLILSTVSHQGSLNAGEHYIVSKEVTIPSNVVGNRILIIKTDANNVVFELTNEDNNQANANINLIQPPPADLVVVSTRAPITALAGDEILVEWTTMNIGENPAVGRMKEAIYISTDQEWSPDDILLGTHTPYINLAPENSVNNQKALNLTGVPIGTYYILVRTDILNNFTEQNEQNNEKASDQTIQVDVAPLTIGVATNGKLKNGSELFYRIDVSPDLSNESLLVTLKGDSLAGKNEIYLAYNYVPSKASFDYVFGEAFSGNQEIVVPELIPGTYYLFITGSTMSGNEQDIEILAQILNFELRRIRTDRGGNSGYITVSIDGSKMDPGMTFLLDKNGTSIDGDQIIISDRTHAFCRFNLLNQPLGTYDLVAKKETGEMAILENAFTIEIGKPLSLATNILRPPSTRPGRIISIQIEYQNTGNIDISNPIIKLTSLAGAPIALDRKGLEKGLTTLDLKLTELNAPDKILRPGALGTITVYAQATAKPAFIILIPELAFVSLENKF